MKIPSSLPPVTTPSVSPKKTRPQESATGKANNASKNQHSSQTTQDKILRLFAQAGISPAMDIQSLTEQDKSIARRRRIDALRKINNLQSILNIALNVSVGGTNEEVVDPDWFHAFCQFAENIHSPAMQELWAKIFAVEVGHPGSFSRRSLLTLESLTHRDAMVFSRAVSLACRRGQDNTPRLLVGYHVRKGIWSLFRKPPPEQLNIAAFGLSYPDILALQEMKLLYASEIESGEYHQGHTSYWRYGSEAFTLTTKRSGVALVYYKFTPVGAELYKLVSKQHNASYFTALKRTLEGAFSLSE